MNEDNDKNEPLLDPFSGEGYSGDYRTTFVVSYELLFWVIFLLITLFCILDRFTTQLLLLKIKFPALDPTSNQPGPIPAAMAFFDMWGRITGRLFLTVLNALFFTQCKTIENVIMEKCGRWKWLHLGDLRTLHNKIHYILGVFFMLIPMIIHCWAIFLPVIFGPSQVGLAAQPGFVNVTPFIDTGGNIIVSTDNIYRLVMVTIVFGIVFPVSMANYCRIKYFSGTQWLHLFGAFIFSIDMLRRAPHAQIFNSPMLIIYVIDRLVGLFVYRTGEATIIHHLKLDDSYTIVFFYIPNQKRQREIGSVYYLGFRPGESQLEITHPYACFQNHTDEPLKEGWKHHKDASSDAHAYAVKGTSIQGRESEIEMDDRGRSETVETDDQVFFSNWNTAAVVQVHHTRNGRSWSNRISQKRPGERIRFFGPYNSEYSGLTPDGRVLPPLVLAGTGGGAPFLLDFYFHFVANNTRLANRVDVYFSTDSVGLFQFVTDACAEREIENWNFNAHLTKHDHLDNRGTTRESSKRGTSRNVNLGRASFEDVLAQASKDTEVYFCGNAFLQQKIEIAAKRHQLTFYPGHRFSAEAPANTCEKVGPCSYVARCTRFPCALCY